MFHWYFSKLQWKFAPESVFVIRMDPATQMNIVNMGIHPDPRPCLRISSFSLQFRWRPDKCSVQQVSFFSAFLPLKWLKMLNSRLTESSTICQTVDPRTRPTHLNKRTCYRSFSTSTTALSVRQLKKVFSSTQVRKKSCTQSVLRIRDVYPGSWFVSHSRSRIQKPQRKIGVKKN